MIEYLRNIRKKLADLAFALGIGRYSYSRNISRRLIGQFFLTISGVAVGVGIFGLGCTVYFSSTDWWREIPVLSAIVYLGSNSFLGCYLAGVLVCSTLCVIRFFRRPLGYLDELVDAAEQLTRDPGRPILLPEMLREAQDHLNAAREKALRDAAAAREAEQRKNDLIVYLAHDLKTPLTSVIGYLTLLREEEEISEKLREKYTGIALDKALRLEDLINEFFDITRFNLTTLTLEPERTNLSRMLEQVVSEFAPVLAEKELTWQAEIAPGVELRCDRDKLQRVLDNLLRNAISYSYPGTAIQLTMAPAGEQVELRVKNRGRTIPPEKLSRIFEQFYRVDSSRASATGGAGLGLAIAREIVELHGGSIRAESADESVTFTVLLPMG